MVIEKINKKYEDRINHLKFDINIWNDPLDLLLEAIKSMKVSIHDIPIQEITRQYLEAIKYLRKMDINIASNFISMAATLVHIKSKILLPQTMNSMEDGFNEEDPREELVQQLLEYQKYKQSAEKLSQKEHITAKIIERKEMQTTFDFSEKEQDNKDTYWEKLSLFDLMKVFSGIVDVVELKRVESIREEEYKIEDKIEVILGRLSYVDRFIFYDLFSSESTKIEIIVTFWAILELYKIGKIEIKQHRLYGDIHLIKK